MGVCCEYKSAGSLKEYVVRVHGGGCAAYQSFVDFNGTAAGKRWPEPGVGIKWVAPQEPVCKAPIDCKELLNSSVEWAPLVVGCKGACAMLDLSGTGSMVRDNLKLRNRVWLKANLMFYLFTKIYFKI